MADTGKIYIVITTNPNGGQPSPTVDEAQSKKDNDKPSLLKNYAFTKTVDFVKQQIKADIDYSITNIGNFTGNYQQQREVQESLNVLGIFANIGMATLTGAKLGGGVPGAIIGFTVSTLATGLNIYRTEKANRIAFGAHQYEIDLIKERSGLNTLTNGNRTGF